MSDYDMDFTAEVNGMLVGEAMAIVYCEHCGVWVKWPHATCDSRPPGEEGEL